MSFITTLFPRRPPLYYLIRLLQFFLAIPCWTFPYAIYELVTAMSNVVVVIYMLSQWDTTPTYEYIPKRKRRPPDKSPLKCYLLLLSTTVILLMQRHLSSFASVKCLQLQGRTKLRLRTTNRYRFKLRSRGGSQSRNQSPTNKETATRRTSGLKGRLMALASFLDQDHDDGVFDTDSFPIAINNCASFTMTSNEKDLVGTTTTVHKNIQGLGSTKALKKATVRWNIEDDQGRVETFEIPGTLLVPNLPV